MCPAVKISSELRPEYFWGAYELRPEFFWVTYELRPEINHFPSHFYTDLGLSVASVDTAGRLKMMFCFYLKILAHGNNVYYVTF